MLVSGLLNLNNAVTITRKTETSDGFGGTTTTSSTTTLLRSNIWTASNGDRTLSDKMAKSSTHVLALDYGAYTFTPEDSIATYNGHDYKITGNMDNVGERNELILMGLVWLQ